MKRPLNFKIDSTGWKSTISQLKKISGKTYAEVLLAEASEITANVSARKSVLEADKAKIVGHHMPVDIYLLGYVGKKLAYTLKEGEVEGVEKQTTYYLKNRLRKPVWDYIYQKTKKRTIKKFKNYGLNKGQMYLMNKMLNLSSPKKKFPESAKKFYSMSKQVIQKKIYASAWGFGKSFKIKLESKLSKMLTFGKMPQAYRSVLKARVRKFEKALGKGVMSDIKKRTRAYPLLFKK